jgi:3-hydroxy-9,10-secoandrosta-1,3,5(10)-triene-9,17-dione monooxygenase
MTDPRRDGRPTAAPGPGESDSASPPTMRRDPARLDSGPLDPAGCDSPASLLDHARALVPALAERAAATEAAREVSSETIAALHATGILHVLQPRRFGGLQQPFDLFSRIIETLAEGCASSAWVYAVLAEHQWIIASYPERGQIDVWGDNPRAVASSSLAPRETATRTAGGWRLSGRFPFSSGCAHAQWAIIGARCEDAAGNTPTRYLLVPMHELEIIDDWHVLGLRGTGSRTLVLRDVFVPEHRSVLLRELLDGTAPGVRVHPEYDVVRAPRGYLVVFGLPGVAFALGRRALALTAAALSGRVSRGVTRMAESETVQLRLAEAAASIEVASLLFHTRRAESVAAIASGRAIGYDEVLRNRRDITFGMQQVRGAVQGLFELSGSRSVYDSDRLQPILRDVQTIATHQAFSALATQVPYGRWLLGLPPGAGEA